MLKRSSPTRLRSDLQAERLAEAALPGFSNLSPRELQVLEYLVAGYSPKEICHALSVRLSAVRTHASRIKRKLGVYNTAHLVYVCLLPLIPRRP